jgi:hypothetical protein
MGAADGQDFDRHAAASGSCKCRIDTAAWTCFDAVARPGAKIVVRSGTCFEHSVESDILSITSMALAKREQKEYTFPIGGFIAYAASIT